MALSKAESVRFAQQAQRIAELEAENANLRANATEVVARMVAREAERLDEAYEFTLSEAYGDVACWLSQQASQGKKDEA